MSYKKFIPFATFVLVYLAHVLYFKISVMNFSPNWWTFYLRLQQYFISFSLALALAYGTFAFVRMRETRSKSAITGSAILTFLIWFTSCCGTPMLAIIVGILGVEVASVLLPPSITALMTVVFVSLGFTWLMKQKVGARLVCGSCGMEMEVLVVHCGPGIQGPDEDRLYCPCLDKGHTENIEMPNHCGKPMKYVGYESKLRERR